LAIVFGASLPRLLLLPNDHGSRVYSLIINSNGRVNNDDAAACDDDWCNTRGSTVARKSGLVNSLFGSPDDDDDDDSSIVVSFIITTATRNLALILDEANAT
jgi:hypothetical protein